MLPRKVENLLIFKDEFVTTCYIQITVEDKRSSTVILIVNDTPQSTLIVEFFKKSF